MKRNRHLCAEEARVCHILQKSITCCHICCAFIQSLAEVIDKILIYTILNNDQALNAKGLAVMINTGVGSCRNLGLDVSCVVCQNGIQLFIGHIQNIDVLGCSQVQLTADRKTCKSECSIQDSVADCVCAIAQTQVLKAGVILGDIHYIKCSQRSILCCGGSRSDGNSLALQIVDVLQAAGLKRYAGKNGSINSTDNADVLQCADLFELAGSVVTIQNDICCCDGDINFSGCHVLYVLEGTCGSLCVALHALYVVCPGLGNSCACRIHGTAGICGAECPDDVSSVCLRSFGFCCCFTAGCCFCSCRSFCCCRLGATSACGQ